MLRAARGGRRRRHPHPPRCSVVEAVREQVGKGIHLQQNCTISRPVVELIEKLNDNTPEELSKFFFNCASQRGVVAAAGSCTAAP